MTKRRLYYLGFIFLAALYITVSLLAPLAPNKFDISEVQTRLLQLTIYLPIVFIWGAAAYGAEKFYSYASSIKKDPDGKALNKIALGLVILVAFQILNGLFGVLRPWALKDNWLAAYTISANVVAVVGPLIAYTYMFLGSEDLLKLIKKKQQSLYLYLVPIVFMFIVAAGYISILVNYDYVNTTPDPTKFSSFYVSKPLVILLYAIPYLLGWGLGIKAALNIFEYRRQIKGSIYKQALIRLVFGILTVTLLYITVGMVLSVSTFLASAGLASILLVLYILIIFYGIGFLLIASGSKKMSEMEQVK